MTASTLLFLLLILACPLMMIFMMRGGHDHGGAQSGHDAGCHGAARTQDPDSLRTSIDDLRRQRDELDHLIEEREQAERELTPTVGPRP